MTAALEQFLRELAEVDALRRLLRERRARKPFPHGPLIPRATALVDTRPIAPTAYPIHGQRPYAR
jgi:hypothetical protein